MSKGIKHRVGDIALHSLGYNNDISIDIYVKIIDIIDDDGNSHYEYDIITGRGDNNSKVKLLIKPLIYQKDLSPCDKKNILLEPHHIFLRYPEIEIKEIESKIEFLQKKIDFFKKNENRIDKLNKILLIND